MKYKERYSDAECFERLEVIYRNIGNKELPWVKTLKEFIDMKIPVQEYNHPDVLLRILVKYEVRPDFLDWVLFALKWYFSLHHVKPIDVYILLDVSYCVKAYETHYYKIRGY